MQLRVDAVLIVSAVMAAGVAMYLAFISPALSDYRIRLMVLIIASGLIFAAIIFSITSILFEAVFRKVDKSTRLTENITDAAIESSRMIQCHLGLSMFPCKFQPSIKNACMDL